eukprot:749654-Hanusia_phi.AAC.3
MGRTGNRYGFVVLRNGHEVVGKAAVGGSERRGGGGVGNRTASKAMAATIAKYAAMAAIMAPTMAYMPQAIWDIEEIGNRLGQFSNESHCVLFIFAEHSTSQFAGTSVSLRSAVCNVAVAHAPRHSLALRMSEDAVAEIAGVNEESEGEQRSLKKTRTNKRRNNNKNKKPLSEYEVGSTVPGKVVSIMPYGAFVDIGTTTDGLVHVSQLADEFVSEIESVVKVGDEVQVRITEINADINKISLSMRSENAPSRSERNDRRSGGGRSELPEKYKNFDDKEFIKGTVASLMDYGAFVTIDEGVDGLVHVSQISEERDIKVDKVLSVGQEKRKRLSLSMREWKEPEVKEEENDIKGWVDEIPADAKVTLTLVYLTASDVRCRALSRSLGKRLRLRRPNNCFAIPVISRRRRAVMSFLFCHYKSW